MSNYRGNDIADQADYESNRDGISGEEAVRRILERDDRIRWERQWRDYEKPRRDKSDE